MDALELVVWRDAHSWMDEPDEYPDDYLASTVGYVVEEEAGVFLRVIGEVTPEGPRAITRIPVGMLVRRVPLIEVSLL
jgi:hypothetical protein